MNNDKSKILLSLMAGAAAGVVAGLLLAPDSGKKSRENLMSSASKWGGDLDRVFRDGLGRLQDMMGTMGVGGAGNKGGQAGGGADEMFDEFSSSTGGDQGGKAAS